MKSIFLILPVLCLALSSAKADQPISQQQLPGYKIAATTALSSTTLSNCSSPGGATYGGMNVNVIEAMINEASSGSIAENGQQPSVSFYLLDSENPDDSNGSSNNRWVMQLTSSQDGKSVTAFTETYQKFVEVNTGTLTAPVIEQQWVTIYPVTCTAQ